MKLRDLRFPIATLFADGLEGGTSGLGGRYYALDFAYDAEFLNGRYDDAIIFDADGKKLRPKQIVLSKPSFLRRLLRRAEFLFIIPDRAAGRFAKVDMELELLGHVNADELQSIFIDKLLQNPDWWGEMSPAGVVAHFDTCESIIDVIDAVGMTDVPPEDRQGRKSSIVVDER